jgi:hypothetical protein
MTQTRDDFSARKIDGGSRTHGVAPELIATMPSMPAKKSAKKRPGRKPMVVSIPGDWEAAVERALKKPKPPGWPRTPKK